MVFILHFLQNDYMSIGVNAHRSDIKNFLWDFENPVILTQMDGSWQESKEQESDRQLYLPATPVSLLGHRDICKDLGIKFPYLAGSMANGISSEDLVTTMGKSSLLGFFGAAGLTADRVEKAIITIQNTCQGEAPFGFNLIHSPNEPGLESAISDLYLKHGIPIVEASAFLKLTLPLVRYRLAGIYQHSDGTIVAPNKVIAKVSRLEMAEKFLSPVPAAMLQQLVAENMLTPQQAEWSQMIPAASHLTIEADSGGHTDNRPLVALFPAMAALKDRMQAKFSYKVPLFLGVAGGIATPHGLAAAFSMGADYVVTGSINQSCREAGTSDDVKKMLAEMSMADTMMAAAADMFEMGVKVQVLKKGTMFPMRANRLFDLYKKYTCLEDIPDEEQRYLQDQIFRQGFESVWQDTTAYFRAHDPQQIQRALRDKRHQMALIFRSYLGRSSTWANQGEMDRRLDFQIWCGPSMGAFNEWTQGSFLARPEERDVVTVAFNLLAGATVVFRQQVLKSQGYFLREESNPRPLTREELSERVSEFRND